MANPNLSVPTNASPSGVRGQSESDDGHRFALPGTEKEVVGRRTVAALIDSVIVFAMLYAGLVTFGGLGLDTATASRPRSSLSGDFVVLAMGSRWQRLGDTTVVRRSEC